ncbi:DUF2188 domain-containing protein [Kocuria sp. M1R5S2]|uniref:DUF2188 domain-containing protein n=1 Tax=Kocuria rhizosphaerae TaxID=3376285 RepID=UPI0037A491D0
MPTPNDCVVRFQPHRGWEVKAPDAGRAVLCSTNRAEALQWAWNIVRTTGGQVVLQRGDGCAA